MCSTAVASEQFSEIWSTLELSNAQLSQDELCRVRKVVQKYEQGLHAEVGGYPPINRVANY